MRPSRSLSLAVLTALSLLLVACGGVEEDGSATGSDTPDASTGDVELAAEQVLQVRFYDEPSGWDPATLFRIENENVAFNIYNGLTSYDGDGQIVPDLAESWETEDNIVWTFRLAEGVQWQGGYGELTADDVVYSYQRVMDPATGSPYAGEFGLVESIEAVDPLTVRITLSQPDGNFLHQVANYHQGQIVKREAIEERGADYKFNPIGTGPFQLASFQPGSSIVLERFDDYFKGPATLERIEYRIILDDETAAIALENGEVDVAMRISQDSAIERLDQAGYTLHTREGYALFVKQFNPDVDPLADPRVRQAWAHAVDWATITETVAPRTQVTAINILPEWMDVYTDDVPTYPFDPERAKELLAEAGYPDGFSVSQLGNSALGVREADQLEQSYLAEVGIDLEFDLVDAANYNSRRNSGDFEVSGRLLPAINPDTILFGYLSPQNVPPSGLNGSRYDDPEVYDTLLAARAATDPEERLELYAEVQRAVLEDLPYLPTYAGSVIWAAHDYVTGIEINPLAQVDMYPVAIEER